VLYVGYTVGHLTAHESGYSHSLRCLLMRCFIQDSVSVDQYHDVWLDHTCLFCART